MAKGAVDLLSDGRYLRAVTDSLQRIDRIIADSDTVEVGIGVAPAVMVPAYQHGSKIILCPAEIARSVSDPTDEDEVLPMLFALNLHEYGHYDFTPRPDNNVWKPLREAAEIRGESGIFTALNALEDQRQELLVSTRFPRARNYFRLQTLSSAYAVKKTMGSIPPENFLLYYGRRHIMPRPFLNRLEDALRKKYGDVPVDRVKVLIDEYARISATDDAALVRMWEIAEEVYKTFGLKAQQSRGECLVHSRIGARTSKSDQQRAAKEAGAVLDHVDQGQQELGDKDPGKDIGDMLKDYIKKAGHLAGLDTTLGEQVRADLDGNAAQKLGRLFKQVAIDLGLKDHSRLRKGKLDVRRIPHAVARGETRIFRRRRQSLKSEAAMLVHVTYDSSGSMDHNRQTVVDASATIAKACHLAGHVAKVSTFSSGQRTIKEWSEESVNPRNLYWYSGGTVPLPTFKAALKDFKQAQGQFNCHNKVLIVITDGDWSSAAECAAEMHKLKDNKVHIFLIGIGQPVSKYNGRDYNSHSFPCDASVTIGQVSDLERVMKALLKRLSVEIAQEVVQQYD